jgi:hypothetical protein
MVIKHIKQIIIILICNSMDKIIEMFKKYDMDLLITKKNFIIEELKKNKELQEKLVKTLDNINKAIEELKNMSYDSE